MVMAIENTPHGLSGQSPHHHQCEHRDDDHHDDEGPDQSGGAAGGAKLVAGHLAKRTTPSPGGDPQHQVVLHRTGEHRAEDDPDAAGQVAHLGGQYRPDEWSGSGDGGEMMAEQHTPVGRHVVGAVVKDLRRGGVVVAGVDDLCLDQPRIEPVSDDIGADRRDDEPHRVYRLAPNEGDDRPGHRAEYGDHSENDLVPGADGRAVDDRDGRQVGVGVDVAQVPVMGVGGRRPVRWCCHGTSLHDPPFQRHPTRPTFG